MTIKRYKTKHSGTILLITLLLIGIISGSIALLLAQSDRILNLSQHSLGDAQISKIYTDMEHSLPKMISKISTAHDLEYAMIFPFQNHSEDGRFKLDISLKSSMNKININKLCDSFGNVSEQYSGFLSTLFSRYPIVSPETFTNIVCDTLDSDLIEHQARSKISIDTPDFHNGSIEDYRQFYQIISRYYTLTKDSQIYSIPWEKIIGFEGEKIDINYVSIELLSLLAPQLDTITLHRLTDLKTAPFESKEEVLSVAGNLAPIYDQWFSVYTSAKPYLLVCETTTQLNGEKSRFEFHIDTLNRTISHLKIQR